MPNRHENLSHQYDMELPTEKEKPWGSTIAIHPESVAKFLDEFFHGEEVGKNPSPRFLVVNQSSRLSWQVHQRRSELWRVVKGPVGYMLSTTDEQPATFETANEGELIRIGPNIRHRLIGLNQEGIIAEVWVHADTENPSDANDIVRLEDDYLR